MEIKKTKWEDITISDYKRICSIKDDDAIDDIGKSVACLAVLCECGEEDIWNLPMCELGGLIRKIGWTRKFDYKPKKRIPNKVSIAGRKFDVMADLQQMSVAAYVDYQAYCDDRRGNMGLILTCFVYPEGSKYAEGYDVRELATFFEDNVSIVLWNDISFFLLKNWLNSIRSLQIYLRLTIDRLSREERTELERRIREKGLTLSSIIP